MKIEKAPHTSTELPLCPSCAKSMMLIQTWFGIGKHPERSTFECKRCGTVFTEIVTGESSIRERVIALHQEICDAPQ
jgi:uncharacterized Zn finger protein